MYVFTEADYTRQSFVMIPSGSMEKQQFTIDITNDEIIECTEIFKLSITTGGTWCGVNIHESGIIQVTIIDDDGKY